MDLDLPVELHCPIHLYEADITAQVILSYEWLAIQNFLVVPKKHAVAFQDWRTNILIQGMGITTRRLNNLRQRGEVRAYLIEVEYSKRRVPRTGAPDELPPPLEPPSDSEQEPADGKPRSL